MNRDSLTYTLTRDQIRDSTVYPPEYEGYFIAAQGLADKALYREASELLVELFSPLMEETSEAGVDAAVIDSLSFLELQLSGGQIDSEAGSDSRIRTAQTPKTLWRITTALSYDQYDYAYLSSSVDNDTVDTVYSLLDEIDDQPLNGNARISLDWRPGPEAIELVAPFVYLSNTRARMGFGGEGSFAHRFLSYNINVEGEKRLFESYGDSSDAVKADAAIMATTRPLDQPVSYTIPVDFKSEQYLEERIQYTSFWEMAGKPSLEFQAQDFSRRLAISMDCSYRRYSYLNSEDNEIQYGPVFAGELWSGVVSGYTEASLRWENFPARSDPARRLEADLQFQCSVRPAGYLTISCDASGLWQKELYSNQLLLIDNSLYFSGRDPDNPQTWESYDSLRVDTVASYNLIGYGGQVRPSVQINFSHGISIPVSLGMESYRYPEKTASGLYQLYDTLYISESYRSCEPQLGVRIDAGKMYASVSCAYRMENCISEKYLEDNSSVMPAIEISWRIAKRLTIDCYGDWQHRMYESGKREDNISASLTVGVRF
jgi:hypothetical protein